MNREQIIDLIDRKISFEDMRKAELLLQKNYEINKTRMEAEDVKIALKKGNPIAIPGNLIIGYEPVRKAFETAESDFIQIERPVEAIEITATLPEPEYFAIVGRNEWGDINDFYNIIGPLRLGEIYLPVHSAIFNFLNPTEQIKKDKIQSVLNGVQINVYNRENYVDNCLHEIGHLFWRTCTRFEEKMQFKELHKYLRQSCIFEYEWERRDAEEVFCTVYKWYMKSVLINKSFYNILEYEEPHGLKILQQIFDRIAKDRIIDDIWEMSKEEVIEYLNPKFDKTSGKFIRKSGAFDRIKDIELPEQVLTQIESVQDGLPYISFGKALVPVNGNMIDFQKAKDLSKLTRKQITDKRGHVKTVWIRTGAEEKKESKDSQTENTFTVKDVIGDFIKKSSIDFNNPNETKGECDTIANKLYVDLSRNGIKNLEIIEGIGLKQGLGEKNAWEDKKEDAKYFSHVVVKIGDNIIDLTGSQFGKKYNKKMYSFSDFKKNWTKIKDGPYWSEAKKIKENSNSADMTKAVNLDQGQIYLDMDGCVTDFASAYKTHFDRDVFKDDQFTVFQMLKTCPHFFRDIPVLEKGKELYNRLAKKYQVIFLTTPAKDMEYCKIDKLAWLKDNICENPTVIFADDKSDYAQSEKDILVDDMEHNLDGFANKGGTSINFNSHNNDEILAKIAETFNPQEVIRAVKQQLKTMQVNTEPSERQKETGNYAKGRIIFKQIPIMVENPKGSVRWGIGQNGLKWMNKLNNHYGYISGTVGNDFDPIDVFIGDDLGSSKVFVINQGFNGLFDEHKIMLGFSDINSAREAFLKNYEKGWEKNIMSIGVSNTKRLREWIKDGVKTEPFVGDK